MKAPLLPRRATHARVARPLLEPAMSGGDYDPRADGSWEEYGEMVAELEAHDALEERIAVERHRTVSMCSRPRATPRRSFPRRRGTRCRRSTSSDNDGGDDGDADRRAGDADARR